MWSSLLRVFSAQVWSRDTCHVVPQALASIGSHSHPSFSRASLTVRIVGWIRIVKELGAAQHQLVLTQHGYTSALQLEQWEGCCPSGSSQVWLVCQIFIDQSGISRSKNSFWGEEKLYPASLQLEEWCIGFRSISSLRSCNIHARWGGDTHWTVNKLEFQDKYMLWSTLWIWYRSYEGL